MRSVRVRPWWAMSFFAICGACAAPSATPVPQPAPAVQAPPARDPLEEPWSPVRAAGSFSHTIRLSSTLVSRIDSVDRTDSSAVMLAVEWSRLAGAEPARLSGLITDYRLASGALESTTLPGLVLPVPFTALEGNGAVQTRLVAPASGACGLQAAVMLPLRELFVSAPPRLRAGTQWSDSASYSVCRDSIPLQVESVRSYRVTGAALRGTDLVVLVDRTSRVTLTGEGRQFGETLTIAGEGSGTMQLELRATDATIESARGESELRMTMRGRRRAQELRQHTRIEIASP